MRLDVRELIYWIACLNLTATPLLSEAVDVKSGFWYVYSVDCGGTSYFQSRSPVVVADNVCVRVNYTQRVCAGWPDSIVAATPPSVYGTSWVGPPAIYMFSCTNEVVTGGVYSVEYDSGNTARQKDLGSPKCNGVGNPINSSTGNKYEEILISRPNGGLSVELAINYNSMNDGESKAFGVNWRHTYERRIYPPSLTYVPITSVFRPDGKVFGFQKTGGAWIGSSDSADKLEEFVDASQVTTGWRYTSSSDEIENYSADGFLLSITKSNGATVMMTYSDGTTGANGGSVLTANGEQTSTALPPKLLIQVTNQFDGSSATFGYDANSRVVKYQDLAGSMYLFRYDEPSAIPTSVKSYSAGNTLTSIQYPGGATRTLWYNEQDKTAATDLPNALTGIVDENGNRFATWYYNSTGKAISSEHAGGVEKYSVTYLNSTNTSSTVVDPLGSQINYSFATLLGTAKLTSKSQPAGSGCLASTSGATYDANGNLASQTDFNGSMVCYSSDLVRNLEATKVSGLAKTAACSGVVVPNVNLPAGSFKVSTKWHPNRRLVVGRAEPGRIKTSIYNGQLDPTNANAPASCASGAVLLPDGMPIAVLCKEVEQSTTDVDGHLGFGAPLQSGVADRITQWTYNNRGQVLTSIDSLNNLTSYTYYPSTLLSGVVPNQTGYTLGDLHSITNAAGQTTTFDLYDAMGRVLQITDPKGVVTQVSYTPRGWVSTVLSAAPGALARVTSYSYDGVGQVIGVTNPDGSTLSFSYDAAHRLVGATDARGNSVSYTLDNVGNRISEQIKDPSGNLQRSIARSFDALNRMQQISGAAQ